MTVTKFGNDLTQGSIPRHLLTLALPMLIANLLNTGYQIVDAIWIGRIVGKEAIGAVAVSFPVVFIFIGVAVGATVATTILVSQYYGARNYKKVEEIISTSFILSVVFGVIISISGIMFNEHILKLMGTPEALHQLASSYLRLTFAGLTVLYLSYLVTSILRGLGDTKTPLLFTAIGVTVNAILDPLFIIGIGPFPKMGLDGAALASILSSFVALLLAFGYLKKKGLGKSFKVANLKFSRKLAAAICKIGFPSMIQQSAISIGMFAVISYVNRFGEIATAAFGAGHRIEAVAFLPAMSIGLAVSSISGQNLGAGNFDRVHKTFRWGLLFTVSVSAFLSINFLIFANQLLSMFTTDQSVIDIGSGYLRIVGPSTIMFAVMYVSNGVINGAGHTITTLVFTVISIWGIRVPLSATLSRTSLGITGIWIAFAASFFVTMCISLWWYYSGKWKKITIKASVEKELWGTEKVIEDYKPGV
ncbi:MATE family efflux transporter [Chitinispirillales bacterium ANBcel5]|uniref:MATE family efflux transporter n=1 Tax=Cellulosispirillum alkaliphilum TaxID=3039283 RepID=UPI002A501E38|nr:MATE family efflux transporter [Chitinispirillales bacterium ANBcel5]